MDEQKRLLTALLLDKIRRMDVKQLQAMDRHACSILDKSKPKF